MRVVQSPEQVVETALRALEHGRSHVISGWANYFMIESGRLMPRSLIARVVGNVFRNNSKVVMSNE
jgi:short-subunit dehydrogenase